MASNHHRTPSRLPGDLYLAFSVYLLCSVCLAVSQAQITLDGSVGPRGPLTGPHYVIPATVGQTRGPNLFHSFGEFNVRTGESATFTGPSPIDNILGRVTGEQPSLIDGLLRSTIPGANLYLLNPHGVMFGPNASLNVSGSFHVSTADYLRLADGAHFAAHLGEQSTLTAAPPAAFGFLGPTPAPITVLRSSLLVPPGETLAVVGGDISIAGNPALTNPQPPLPIVPTLRALGGQIHLASVASAGEVSVDLLAQPTLGAFERLGHITLAPDTLLNVSGIGAGTVAIRGGRFTLDNATLIANTLGAVGGGGIDIAVETLTVTGGGAISSSTFGPGRGGRLSLTATDAIVITGRRADNSRRSSLLNLSNGLGDAGDIFLSAPRVTLDDGASILTTAIGLQGQTGKAAMLILALSGGQGCPSIPNELQWAIPLSKEVEMTSPLGFEDLQSILYQRIDPWPDHRKEGPNTNTVRHSFCR